MRNHGFVIVGLALVLVFAIVITTSARVLDQRSLRIRVSVAAMQELQVLEPVAVAVSYPWEGADQGRPLEIKNVGMVRIRSNSGWVLYPDVVSNSRFRVSVRPSNSPTANWMVVSGNNPVIAGSMGSYDLSFDVRVETSGSGLGQYQEIIELGFTASQP
ncbi:MAG: hypothetical protein WBH35_06575 [Bacillota bacterium]|jgi:hypothetical protein|nr:hypothetical protein [Bacillota bacterium]HOB44283.1 hypothetical protein [Bacillota bacterium]HPT62310.1 hypothetical protein [Bacillota bacterium]